MNTTMRFFRSEEGVTAIEYGLLAALIAVVIIVALETIGNNLFTAYTCITETMASGNKGASC
ncbi:MAG: Flp family type IVb pilin [Burkholderiales bacterium]